MVAAIRQRVTVQPGGLIELRSADLVPGSDAEVIVLIEQALKPAQAEGLSNFIGAAKGVYVDAEDADRHVRSELLIGKLP